MEQHPVPQNVTTFQFRLIGDMTIKQFGYLAGGAVLAYICYKLPLPFFISWPLAFIAGLAGFGFAFVPVEDRPMDIWVMSFIKNVYSPTQFVWSHEKPPAPVASQPMHSNMPAPLVSARTSAPAPSPVVAKPEAAAVLQGIFAANTPPLPHPSSTTHSPVSLPAAARPGPFGWLTQLFGPKHTPAIRPTQPATQAAAIPTPSVVGRHLDISSPPQVTPASAPVATPEAKAPIAPPPNSATAPQALDQKAEELHRALEEKTQTSARVLELQKQLMDVLAERDKMRHELAAAKTTTPPVASAPPPTTISAAASPLSHQPAATAVPRSSTSPQSQPEPTVKIITPEGAVKAGLPRLTTFPNVVTGITRDADNNLLPGVLVTVKDADGVPLRALKTNRLGQFAASTPIANGTYFVEIEDPRDRYVFDRVQVTLNGSIVPALEIIAKSQKQVARDKLAKEIFGA